jgi:hypothetical protein
MKNIKIILASLALLIGVGLVFVPHDSAYAVNVIKDSCAGHTSAICADTGETVGPLVNNIVNILLYILGAIAVIMIVIGGVMYTTSGGDAGSVKKAKDTILYAVIGLVVAIFAYAIINFVVRAIK